MTISKYRESFLCETVEYLQSFAEQLLKLEKRPDDEDVIGYLLRCAHTMKGMAASMGYKKFVDLTHEMESVLILMRDRRVMVTSEAVNLLYRCQESLQAMIAKSGRKGSSGCQPLIRELRQLAGTEIFLPGRLQCDDLPCKDADSDQLRDALEQGEHGHHNATPIPLQAVRVDIDRLDSLYKLAAELAAVETRLEALSAPIQNPELQEVVEQMGHLISSVQSSVRTMRMIPARQVFSRFSRMVRDLARQLNKSVLLAIQGDGTEFDRSVADGIMEPLVHLLRNAVDHGIESPAERALAGKHNPARLSVAACSQGNELLIEITDDGRGIDLDRVQAKALEQGLLLEGADADESTLLNIIFEPGFSTAEQVTDISGRGLGLDIAKNKIASLGGSIFLETRRGQGTSVIIRLPLPSAIFKATALAGR